MCQSVLKHGGFGALLRQIDEEECCRVQGRGCRHCGGPLDRRDHRRKPRCGPFSTLGAEGQRRCNLCCRHCRHGSMPPSVLFLGRRVFPAVVVVLASVLAGGLTPRRLARVRELLGVPAWTVRRWRRWWQTDFVASAHWTAQRGSFLPPVDPAQLPRQLLGRFAAPDGTAVAQLVVLLRWLSPLSTMSEVR